MQLMTSKNCLSLAAEKKIIGFIQKEKELAEQKKEFNNALLSEMKKRGILSYKDENMTISYVCGGERTTFDSKAFKNKFPDIFKKYSKTNQVGDFARITIKKGITTENMHIPKEVETQMIGISSDEKAF